MQNKGQRNTLPELLVQKTHLHWYTVTALFTLILLAGLIVSAIMADTPFNQLGLNFWRIGLQGPAIIIYIMLIYPILTQIGNHAVESIVPWVEISQEELNELNSKYRKLNRLWECAAFSIGALITLLLFQPWRGIFDAISIFLFTTEIIMFSLLSLLIYYGFHNARYMTMINKHLKLDLFNMDALAPIARWSLSISLAFTGGIAISILFQNIDNLRQWPVIIIYTIIIISTAAMFFISLWSTHKAIVKVKKRELAMVQEKFTRACRKLMLKANENNSEGEKNYLLYSEVAAWALYERRIREAKEWPYNAGIIRQLIVSIVSSGAIYIVKLLWGSFPGS